MNQTRIKAGVLEPRDADAHEIRKQDIEAAKLWTAKLSQPGKARRVDGSKVTIKPKMARLFWR